MSPVLRAYGIHTLPTWIAADSAEAVHIAEQMGYPVALKLRSPDIPISRKSRGHAFAFAYGYRGTAGGRTRLSIASKWHGPARIHGLLVQSMANRAGAQERGSSSEHDPVLDR